MKFRIKKEQEGNTLYTETEIVVLDTKLSQAKMKQIFESGHLNLVEQIEEEIIGNEKTKKSKSDNSE